MLLLQQRVKKMNEIPPIPTRSQRTRYDPTTLKTDSSYHAWPRETSY